MCVRWVKEWVKIFSFCESAGPVTPRFGSSGEFCSVAMSFAGQLGETMTVSSLIW